MTIILLAAALAASAPAEPGELRTFRDWTVGCDNGRACTGIALLPETADWEQWVTMSLRRGPAPGDAAVAMLQNVDGDPVTLLADGNRLDVRFEPEIDGHLIVPRDPATLVAALRQAQTLEARNAEGVTVGRVSLSGASAAMLYMDEQQRRLGTVTALVRPGSAPASAVPASPAYPVVRLAPDSGDAAPVALSEEEVTRLRREAECTIEEVGGPDHHESVALAPGRSLILLACGSGAYNVTSIPYIAERGNAGVSFRIAPFDRQWGLTAPDIGEPTLINAEWDAEARLLREFSKARGLGDCGTHASYGWDGTRFRLVEQEEMGECRGSLHYVRTWKAQVVRR